MLIDIHCHNDPEHSIINAQLAHQMASVLSATTPNEYYRNQQLAGPNQLLSYGVHPWHAQDVVLDRQLLAKTKIIGEIGLDNTWTKTPLAIQREVFHQQLAFANSHGRPVVIHVKGCESEMLADLQAVPSVHKLIHWYSAKDYLADYLAIPNTWFSVGPDVFTNQNVQQVAKQVPLNRLFIESDGFESLEWALGHPVNRDDYYQIIQKMYEIAASYHQIEKATLITQIMRNWDAFLGC